jgi:UDP-perosamine 4-acetyltransferase
MRRVVFGCGSQALYVLDNLLALGERWPDAFVDLEKEPGPDGKFEDIPVLGLDEALARCHLSDTEVLVAHGDNQRKLSIAGRLASAGFRFFSAVHPSSIISPLAKLGSGCIINAGTTILPRAKIGPHVIIHSGAVVEHDCTLGAGCNIAPGAVMAGRVNVGSGAYLYTGCSIAPRVRIGDGAVVAAGAIVLKSVPDGARVAGCPARPI